MFRLILCIAACTAAAMLQAQPFFRLSYSFAAPAVERVYTDELGNVYTQSRTEFRKYNMNDTLFARYSEMSNGSITTADISNPMRITLFFSDFSRVLILDNALNTLRSTIDLTEEGMEQVIAVCSSYDGGLWMYNRDNFSLQRYTVQMKPDRSIFNLNTVISAEFKPELMLEKENLLYVLDPRTGLHLFDIFAGYLKSLPLPVSGNFTILDNSVYWLSGNRLYRYSMARFTEESWPVEPQGVSAFGMSRKKMVLYAEGRVYVYLIE